MDDYLTRVAEAVRDACAEACHKQHTIAERRPIPATICAMHIGHIDLPEVIASVPRPEPVAAQPAVPDGLLTADDMKALRRFIECAEDWDCDGHDVSKEAMKRLERAGAVRSLGFGRHETTAFGDAMLAAAPEAPEHGRPVQWWLAKLDQYGNPTLVDGAHSQRAGADEAFYLNSALGLAGSGKYAVARVELSEPVADGSNVNHDAVSTLGMAMQHNAAAPEAPQMSVQDRRADELQESIYGDRDEIAGLRARIAELEADNSEYEAFVNECRFMSPGGDVPLHGLADRMRADKRALRIDAERYRWIRDKERFHVDGECGDATFSSCMCCAEEFDDAIDAARAQQKNPTAP